MKMIIITFLLCALANQAVGQTKDIFPAKILSRQRTISQDSDLYLTCSLFGAKKESSSLIFVYLLKDNSGFKRKTRKHSQNDVTFDILAVSPRHSGSYSCVYSPNNYTLSEVDIRGLNMIQVQVIATFLPADISIVGPSSVWEGDHVVFRCTVSDILQTVGDCQLIHSYLRINGTVMSVQAFNVTGMEATFTIQGALLRDRGHYNCIVLPSKCIQGQEKMVRGRNTVFLQVTEYWSPRVIILIMLMLFLGLGLFMLWISTKLGSCSSQCAQSQQADGDVLEVKEEQTEHGEGQGEGEESFSYEEPAECSHEAPSEFVADFDLEIYSVVDDFEY